MSLRVGKLALSLLLPALLAFAVTAHAARVGTVDVEGTEIYDGPGKGFRMIDKLSKGSQVATSNLPTEGFFKVRTSAGVVGWISAESLILSDPGGSGSTPSMDMSMPPPLPQGGGAPPNMPGPASTAPDFRSSSHKKFVRVRLLGGATFLNAQNINDRLNFNALKTGAHFGGEVNFMFTPDLAMVIRVEHVLKNLVGEDAPTNKTYQLDLTSFPVMAGIELLLSKTPKFSTSFSMMAGLGVQTQLKSTGLDFTEPNVTILSDTSFTGLAKLTFSWNFWKTFAIFGEGGYRILKSKEVLPSTRGNGSEIFNIDGAPSPLIMDLSGPIVGAGFTFVF